MRHHFLMSLYDEGNSYLYHRKYYSDPFILLFIKQIFKWLKKQKLFRSFIIKLENRAMGKSDRIKRYEFLGLFVVCRGTFPEQVHGQGL